MEQSADYGIPSRTTLIKAVGLRPRSLASILSNLSNDPQQNRLANYRVVETHDPSLCLFHLIAGWLAGQIVVFAGRVETAVEMLSDKDFVVAEDITLGDAAVGPVYSELKFPSPPSAPAAVVMSSGTTGKPKGILLTRSGIEASADLLIEVFRLKAGETYGSLSPVHTMGGLRAFMLALRYGHDVQFFEGAHERDLAYAKRVLSSDVAVVLSGASFVRLLDLASRWMAGEKTELRAIMSCGSLYDDRASRAVRDAYGIDVVNLSFGNDSKQSAYTSPLNWAVQQLWDAGIVVVASAGNLGDGPRQFGRDEALSRGLSFGQVLQQPDVAGLETRCVTT